MSKPGPNDNESAKGSRILRRVGSLMSFMGIMSEENTELSSAPAPIVAPTPAPALVAVAPQNTEKEPKEKKEQSAKSSRFKRISMQVLPSSLFGQPSVIQSTPSSPTDHKKEKNQNKGPLAYETHDKKKIYAADLRNLPVTVCTYAEREQQLKNEKIEREKKEKQREQGSASPRLTTLQELFAQTPAPLVEPAPLVRRGSVIYSGSVPTNTPAMPLDELEALLATPTPAPAAILTRKSSMVLLTDAVAALTPFEEENKRPSARP